MKIEDVFMPKDFGMPWDTGTNNDICIYYIYQLYK